MTDERDARCVTCDGLVRHHLIDTGMCPAYHTIAALRARLGQVEAERDQWRALAGRLAAALGEAVEAVDWLLEGDARPDDDPGPGIRTDRERWRAALAEYAAAAGEEERP